MKQILSLTNHQIYILLLISTDNQNITLKSLIPLLSKKKKISNTSKKKNNNYTSSWEVPSVTKLMS